MQSLTTDFGEIAIDSLLKDGLLKDIPIIGSAFSVLKLGRTISDKIFLSKIYKFIKEIRIHTKNEIEEFKEKYLRIKDYDTVGRKLILLLNSADDEKKITWLSKTLILLVDEKISTQDFLRITMIINNSFPDYLEKLSVFKNEKTIASNNSKKMEDFVLEHLYSIGCLSNKGLDSNYSEIEKSIQINEGNVFILSKFGKIILESIL